MADLFGLINQLAGRPDPAMQIAQAMGQTPGQPGSAAGPSPLSPPAPDPGGGGPASPAAGGAAPTPQAPPQPQATQAAPDMMQLYAQFAQQQQASEQFNRGLGMLAAGLYPGRHPEIPMRMMTGMTQDPGAMFQNLMAIQGYQQKRQQFAGLQAAIPGLVKSGVISPEMVPVLQADPSLLQSTISSAQGSGAYHDRMLARQNYIRSHPDDPKAGDDFDKANPIGNVITPNLDPALSHLHQRITDWQNNPANKDQPLPPRFSSPEDLASYDKHVQDLTNTQGLNQAGLQDVNQGVNKLNSIADDIQKNPNLDSLLEKVSANPAVVGIARRNGWLSGKIDQLKLPGDFGLNKDELQLLGAIDGLQKYKISTLSGNNPHLSGKLGAIDSQIGTLQDFSVGAENWKSNLQGLADDLDTTKANAAGAAGALKDIHDSNDSNLEMKIDRSYLPGGVNYLGEPKKWTPADMQQARQELAAWKAKYPDNYQTRYFRHKALEGYGPPPPGLTS